MEQLRLTSNNIKVYSYIQPHVHSFCIGLYVKAGVLYEQPGEGGITHFLEHIPFRNLGGMPQGELYRKLDSIGAFFNAVTYKEFVQFYITATPKYFNQCAEIIAMLLAPLSVTASDVAMERRRIQSEIREEGEYDSFNYLALKETWQGTPLTNPILGTITGLNKIGLPQLREAKEAIFTADNLCFYVTGCCTEENIDYLCTQAGKYAISPGEGLRENLAPSPINFQSRGPRIQLRDTKDLPDLHFSFDIQFSKYSMAEMHLLYDILFNGNLSRIHMELSEKTGLIYSDKSVLDQYSNIGIIYMEYSVAKSRIYDAVQRTVNVIKSTQTDITQSDLELHLPRYCDNYDMMLDDPEDLNWEMAFNNFILGRAYKSIEEMEQLFYDVTPYRLMEIANEVFRTENLVVVIRAPKAKCRGERIKEILSTL